MNISLGSLLLARQLARHSEPGTLYSAASMMLKGVWRNGSASDSRSEGWEFESLCPHAALWFLIAVLHLLWPVDVASDKREQARRALDGNLPAAWSRRPAPPLSPNLQSCCSQPPTAGAATSQNLGREGGGGGGAAAADCRSPRRAHKTEATEPTTIQKVCPPNPAPAPSVSRASSSCLPLSLGFTCCLR